MNMNMNTAPSFPQKPEGHRELNPGELMDRLDSKIIERSLLSDEVVKMGESSPQDREKIAEFDRAIVEICKKGAELSGKETPDNFLATTLRQLLKRGKISQAATYNISQSLKGDLNRAN